jgi:hypothetical protein
MASAPSADSSGDAGGGPHRSTPSTPLWVKIAGAVALLVVLVFVFLLVVGGGAHGPNRHTSHTSRASDSTAVASNLIQGNVPHQ